jgi:hypothetical protein
MILIGQIALGAFIALISAEIANIFLGRWLVGRWMERIDEGFKTTSSDPSDSNAAGSTSRTVVYAFGSGSRGPRTRRKAREWEWDA